MLSITVNGQEIKSGQIVLAKSLFPLPDTSSSNITFQTVFGRSDLRPAWILYFAAHSVEVSNVASSYITNGFAVVDWFMCHPSQNSIGRPFEIWCSGHSETSPENFLVPLENVFVLTLTVEYNIIMFDDENVLLITPLI